MYLRQSIGIIGTDFNSILMLMVLGIFQFKVRILHNIMKQTCLHFVEMKGTTEEFAANLNLVMNTHRNLSERNSVRRQINRKMVYTI